MSAAFRRGRMASTFAGGYMNWAKLSAAAFAATMAATAAFAQKPVFTLVSPGLTEFSMLPNKYAAKSPPSGCDGGNVSPALSWTGAPLSTKSYAIDLFDPASPSLVGYVHWLAYGIPASKTSLKEGEGSSPSSEFESGKNSPGTEAYSGPCPPAGQKPHPYVFLMLATDLAPGSLKAGMTRDELAAALKDHVLGRTTLVFQFGR